MSNILTTGIPYNNRLPTSSLYIIRIEPYDRSVNKSSYSYVCGHSGREIYIAAEYTQQAIQKLCCIYNLDINTLMKPPFCYTIDWPDFCTTTCVKRCTYPTMKNTVKRVSFQIHYIHDIVL